MKTTAIVPTVGASPWLAWCLEALRREGGEGLEILLVDQTAGGLDPPAGFTGRVIATGANLGFAGGVNRGLEESRGDLVAVVNDDLVVEPGWLAAVSEALAIDPRAAAAQGINLLLDDPERVDGAGIAWNPEWQAVQRLRGRPAPACERPPREVFGVSATAALYRGAALDEVALPGGGVFDARLGSYYEDVDLAGRLRAAGWRALVAPAARALHAGSTTGVRLGSRRRTLITANRHLVLARLLGRGYWPRLPALLWRDFKDLARALLAADAPTLAGIPAGWARALRHLPVYARTGPPLLPPGELERFREG